MKKPLILFVAIFFAVTSCRKESKFKHSGIIEGVDYTKCSCCGGYILKIDGSDSSYRVRSFPSGNAIDANTRFPVKIDLNYSSDERCGYNQYITITDMIVTY